MATGTVDKMDPVPEAVMVVDRPSSVVLSPPLIETKIEQVDE
jgi:hypothetical protein